MINEMVTKFIIFLGSYTLNVQVKTITKVQEILLV